MSPKTHNDLTPDKDPFDLALPLFYGAPRQLRRYRKLVELGVRAGDPLAEYAMATWFLFGNEELRVRRDPRRAVALLSRAAVTFNRAMYDLAVCKLRGEGIRQDERGAYRLFAQAASLGCIPAMTAQEYCLSEGIGIARNRARADKIGRMAKRLLAAQRRIS